MRPHIRIRGFTLLELLIVIAILAVVCGIILSAFLTFNRSQSVAKDTETVLETLRSARDQTLASKNQSQYGVHFASSTVTLFAGSSYSSGAGTNVVFFLHSGDTVLTISLNGGGQDVVFSRLSGSTDDYGTIVISSLTASSSNNVTIYSTGLVQGPASL